jgi:hypothetical protein
VGIYFDRPNEKLSVETPTKENATLKPSIRGTAILEPL